MQQGKLNLEEAKLLRVRCALFSARGCGRRNVAWGGGEAETPGPSAIQYASPRMRAAAPQTAQIELQRKNQEVNSRELSPVSRA